MMKRLMAALIEADVPCREILRQWEYLGWIGNVLQADDGCRISYFSPGQFYVEFINVIGNTAVIVSFDLPNGKIHYSIPSEDRHRGFIWQDLTKENVNASIVPMGAITDALKNFKRTNEHNKSN